MSRIAKKGGPRTATGKARSSLNSRKHCLFAAELQISNLEMPEFLRMKSGLQRGLKPNSAVKLFVFDDLIACAWRMKLALRYEQSSIRKASELTADDDAANASRPQENVGGTLRAQIRLINELRERVKENEVIAGSPELEKKVIEVLGTDIGQMLTAWATENQAAWACMQAMIYKNKNFNLETPEALRGHEEDSPMVVVPGIYKLVVCMLLDFVSRNLLRDVTKCGAVSDRIQRDELFFRYYTKARRDFYQVLKDYLALR